MAVALESDLVSRAADGDRAAFAELYDTYLPKIYDFALGMLRNKADAEDVTSETFLKAVERLRSLKDPDAFRGWLYTIARNSALNLIEARKRAVPTAEHDEHAAVDATATPEDHAMSAEVRELVWSAAATLNPRDYQVFELTVRHGLSSAEIAEMLDVRPAYAYILVNRLKSSVEEALEAVLLVRTGRACGELDRIVSTYGEEPTPRMRKAVARHAKSCDECRETKRGRASVTAILAGTAFAAPSAAFAAELAAKIDRAWPPTGGGGFSAGRSLIGLAGSVLTILVLAVGTLGATAQRSIHEDEPTVEVEPASESKDIEDEPTPSPEAEDEAPQAPIDPDPTATPRPPVITFPTDDPDDDLDPEPTDPPRETTPPRTDPPPTRPPRETQPPIR